jgi:hypothetical protein
MAEYYNNDVEAFLTVMGLLVKQMADFNDDEVEDATAEDYSVSSNDIKEIIEELSLDVTVTEFMKNFEEVLPEAYALNSNAENDYWLS